MAIQADHIIKNTSHTELVTLFNIIKSLDPNRTHRVIVLDDNPIRTPRANNYLFFCYQVISDHTGYTKIEVHAVMKYMFNMELYFTPEFAIEEGGSTAELKSDKFNWYIHQVRTWANSWLEMTKPIPEPNSMTDEQKIAAHYMVPQL